jgi:hypothetical protein
VRFWNGSTWVWSVVGDVARPTVFPPASAITYLDEMGKRRIIALANGKGTNATTKDGHLYMTWCKEDAAPQKWCDKPNLWAWQDLGKPSTVQFIQSAARVTTYLDEQSPPMRRIYAIIRGDDGHLHIIWCKGDECDLFKLRRWTDLGTYPGASLVEQPALITYLNPGEPRQFFAFSTGADGQLYVAWCTNCESDNPTWQWANKKHPGPKLTRSPSAITYLDEMGKRRIDVFLRADNNHLYMASCTGLDCDGEWTWADLATPTGVWVLRPPSVITYLNSSGHRKIHAYVNTDDNRLAVNIGYGTKWSWTIIPLALGLVGAPGVALSEPGPSVYVFIRSQQGIVYSAQCEGHPPPEADNCDVPVYKFINHGLPTP